MPDFDFLNPDLVLSSVATCFGIEPDGRIETFNSYVNRVYGIHDVDGGAWIAKFYRPGRWTLNQLEEEHDLLFAAAEAELPVVAPLVAPDGYSVHLAGDCAFALFPKRAGRGFEPHSGEDYYRIGSLIGRLHGATLSVEFRHRLVCGPEPGQTGGLFVEELREAGSVHPEIAPEFFGLLDDCLARTREAFARAAPRLRPLHGDAHRGNILDRPGSDGLCLIDLDDCMLGPAIQDLWMILPDRLASCPSEASELFAGYESFQPLDPGEFSLVEPLRFLRMLYFLAWQNRQRHDEGFTRHFPDWGSRAFWIRELEDFRAQALEL